MDIKKLYDKLLESDEIKDIPIIYIIRIFNCVLLLMSNNKDVFYKLDDI